MNGARAEDSVKMITAESRIKNSRIGVNHHFRDVLRKYRNSENICNRLYLAMVNGFPLLRIPIISPASFLP